MAHLQYSNTPAFVAARFEQVMKELSQVSADSVDGDVLTKEYVSLMEMAKRFHGWNGLVSLIDPALSKLYHEVYTETTGKVSLDVTRYQAGVYVENYLAGNC